MVEDLKKMAGQTAIYGIPTIVGRFLNYLLVPVYTYSLTADRYGVVSELYAYVSFLMIMLTYGMETAYPIVLFSSISNLQKLIFHRIRKVHRRAVRSALRGYPGRHYRV